MYLDHRSRQKTTTASSNTWLFPGIRAGQSMSSTTNRDSQWEMKASVQVAGAVSWNIRLAEAARAGGLVFEA